MDVIEPQKRKSKGEEEEGKSFISSFRLEQEGTHSQLISKKLPVLWPQRPQ